MIKAVIFDMDGLLIDSEAFWRRAHVRALARHGVTITEDDVRVMAGRRTDEVVAHWREQHNLPHVDGHALENEVVAQVIRSIQASGQAMDGVKEVLELFAQHGIPMALASSSAPELIAIVINKLGLHEYIRFAHSGKHEKYGKPHPAIFLTAAQKLHVDPADCLVFEDAAHGVTAAKAAGMRCIAVPEQPHDPAKFKEADVVLTSLKEVNWQLIQSL